MPANYLIAAYFAPLAALWIIYARRRRRRERVAFAALTTSISDGLSEPSSLHPSIDVAKCLGCGACTRACPEGQVIGLIDGKAVMIEAANCIGHGACEKSCPFGAITLVFGTEQRGVDIPDIDADFQTNIPGIFIAGELGGMGLIRNAMEQGRQAVKAIAELAMSRPHAECDLIIIGAGPAGLAAGIAAKAAAIRFCIVEQETFGGTIAHYPRGKVVMTQPVNLPLVGKMRFREVSKERLLSFWSDVLRRHPLPIVYGERVEAIKASSDGFVVHSTAGIRRAATVLLAIGRRGTPRKLDVPGEEQSKVVYRLVNPAQYRNKHVLVVGGGDSALEAAAAIAAEPGTHVTLSYRGAAFSRAKSKNRGRIDGAAKAGKIGVRLESRVLAIGSDFVRLERDGKPEVLANDAVIVCAGGILPTAFLKSIGIRMETKHGTP